MIRRDRPHGGTPALEGTGESGKRWWAPAAEKFTKFVGPTVLEGVLYVSDTNRKLFALDPATGDVMWENTGLV